MMSNFEKFHGNNPHVYERLVGMTQGLLDRGRKRVGMKMLFEVLRWEHFMQTEGEPFKLNNNYTAPYARLLEKNQPQWRGVFEKRRAASDDA
jgi:hypothetical protein